MRLNPMFIGPRVYRLAQDRIRAENIVPDRQGSHMVVVLFRSGKRNSTDSNRSPYFQNSLMRCPWYSLEL